MWNLRQLDLSVQPEGTLRALPLYPVACSDKIIGITSANTIDAVCDLAFFHLLLYRVLSFPFGVPFELCVRLYSNRMFNSLYKHSSIALANGTIHGES